MLINASYWCRNTTIRCGDGKHGPTDPRVKPCGPKRQSQQWCADPGAPNEGQFIILSLSLRLSLSQNLNVNIYINITINRNLYLYLIPILFLTITITLTDPNRINKGVCGGPLECGKGPLSSPSQPPSEGAVLGKSDADPWVELNLVPGQAPHTVVVDLTPLNGSRPLAVRYMHPSYPGPNTGVTLTRTLTQIPFLHSTPDRLPLTLTPMQVRVGQRADRLLCARPRSGLVVPLPACRLSDCGKKQSAACQPFPGKNRRKQVRVRGTASMRRMRRWMLNGWVE